MGRGSADDYKLTRGGVMLHEADIAVLTVDLPEHSLKAGDVGPVALVQFDG